MIIVCTLKGPTARRGVGRCWSFPNSKLNGALAFARIGSQRGRVRRVTICGRFARVYSDGQKVRGEAPISRLRKIARACG